MVNLDLPTLEHGNSILVRHFLVKDTLFTTLMVMGTITDQRISCFSRTRNTRHCITRCVVMVLTRSIQPIQT